MTPSFDYAQFGAARIQELDFMRAAILRFGVGDLDQVLEVEAPRRCIVVAGYVRDCLGSEIQSPGQRDLLVWLRDQISSRSGAADGPDNDLAFAPLIGQNARTLRKVEQHV